jgi:hypothetical protein
MRLAEAMSAIPLAEFLRLSARSRMAVRLAVNRWLSLLAPLRWAALARLVMVVVLNEVHREVSAGYYYYCGHYSKYYGRPEH